MNTQSKGKYIGNIFGIIFYSIAGLLFIMFSIIIYKAYRYPNKIPDLFGTKPMIVLSSSMEKEISTGDLAFIKIVDIDSLKEKDIIAFRNDDNTVTTHRIIGITEEQGKKYFKTKGDSNNIEDENLVIEDNIEGIFTSKISKVGDFLMFMQQPISLAVILLSILVIGMIWLQIINKIENKKMI